MKRSWIVPVLLAVIAVGAVWSAVTYGRLFDGDPEIHIIFAKNLLRGYPLQFNPGEFTSGETSPVYMGLVALMYLAVGDYVPIAMKGAGVASLVGLCVVIHRAARRQGATTATAAVLGVLPLLLPSMVFQALLGMENMLFACFVVLALQAWLGAPVGGRVRLAIGAAGLPLLFFLRPETVLLGACLVALSFAQRDGRSLVALAAGAGVTLAAVCGVEAWTGVPLQAAGHIRAAFSRWDSLEFKLFGDTFHLNPKPVIALVYGVPFMAVVLGCRKTIGLMRDEVIVFATLVCLPLVLHLTDVFPSTHLSRYLLYGYAVFFFLFARLMARAERAGGAPAAKILAAVVLLSMTLVPYEHFARSRQPNSTVDVATREMTTAFIRANSDALYEALGRPPVPVVVAMREVQLRGRLNGRFIVRSLDGIVDDRLAAFMHDGWVDHVGYLKARGVAYVLDLPDDPPDKSGFALAQLPARGEQVAIDGLCFRLLRLSPELPSGQTTAYAVTRAAAC